MKILSPRTQGILWEMVSSISFVALTTLVKYLSQEIPTPTISFYRIIAGFPFVLFLACSYKLKKPQKENIPWYLLRTIIAVSTVNTAFYVFKHLPLCFATTISYTEPMIQLILSILFFHASISASHWLFILLGYVGVFIISFSKMDGQSAATSGILAAVMLSLLISSLKAITKHLTKKEPAHQVLFYSNLLNVFTVTIFTSLTTPSFTTILPPPQMRLFLPLLGIFGFLTQYGLTKALSLAEMHVLAPVTYLRLILAIPLGFYFYNEFPTWMTLLGSAVIIIANFFLLRPPKESKKSKKATS